MNARLSNAKVAGKAGGLAPSEFPNAPNRHIPATMSEGEHQGDLFGFTPQRSRPDPPRKLPLTAADVRERMVELIEALRGANVIPFAPAEFAKHRAMFPIMAQWLEPEDGEQLVFQFEAEVERLLKAA